MGQPPRARRHHFVPRFYLERFTDTRGLITVFDKRAGSEFDTTPLNAAVETDFYTIEVGDERSDAIERALAEGEGLTATALRHVDVGQFPPTPPDRGAIATFVAMQFVRTPAARGFFDDLATDFFGWFGEALAAFPEAMRRSWAEAHGREPTEEEIGDLTRLLRERAFQVTVGPTEHIGLMLELVNVAYPQLFHRSWLIVEADNVVTGDVPVQLWARPEVARFGLGLGTADEIVMPLSPSRALVIAREGMAERVVRLSEEAALLLRQRAWLGAERFTYRRPGSPPPEGIDPLTVDTWGLRPKGGAKAT